MNLQLITRAAITGVAAAALVPAAVLFAECAAALLSRRRLAAAGRATKPLSVAVLIPAHNEAGVVGDTVASLKAQLPPDHQLCVIADNCTDTTAQEAESAGATVWRRQNPEQRGKGFAISFALEKLDPAPPDIVVIVDADCRVTPGSIQQLSALAAQSGRPVQGEYLLRTPTEDGSALSSVSGFAFLVRNLVRPLGLKRLGLPCHLTGSGMAFPWKVIREAPSLRDNLVEDLVMGLEMALAGTAPLFCPEAQIRSELPTNRDAASGQRRRWEHGQLATLFTYVPRLLGAAINQRRVDLLALAADLSVPPLSLLVAGIGGVWVVTAAASIGMSTGSTAFGLASASMSLVAAGVTMAWVGFGRSVISPSALLRAPFYMLWKLPLYVSFFLRKRQQAWVRTERAVASGIKPS